MSPWIDSIKYGWFSDKFSHRRGIFRPSMLSIPFLPKPLNGRKIVPGRKETRNFPASEIATLIVISWSNEFLDCEARMCLTNSCIQCKIAFLSSRSSSCKEREEKNNFSSCCTFLLSRLSGLLGCGDASGHHHGPAHGGIDHPLFGGLPGLPGRQHDHPHRQSLHLFVLPPQLWYLLRHVQAVQGDVQGAIHGASRRWSSCEEQSQWQDLVAYRSGNVYPYSILNK